MRGAVLKMRPVGGAPFLTLQCAEPLIDLRLSELSLCRHPLQSDTPADGDCGVWAIAVQLVSVTFSLERSYIQEQRQQVVNTLPAVLEAGLFNWQGMVAIQTPDAWMESMSQQGQFVDSVFLQLAALLHKRDIILFPCFPSGYRDGMWRLFGDGDLPGCGPPILLMLAEEEAFISPHYQVRC